MTSKYPFSINNISRITKEEKKLLINVGIYSMKDLVVWGAVNISEATDIRRNTCVRICSSARTRLEELGVLNRPFMESAYKEERISLGSAALDNLLDGKGVHTRAITRETDCPKYHFNLKLVHYNIKPSESGDAIRVKNETIYKMLSEITDRITML